MNTYLGVKKNSVPNVCFFTHELIFEDYQMLSLIEKTEPN